MCDRATADLRTMRSGGPVLSDGEIIHALGRAGFSDADALRVDIGLPARLVVGRRAG